MRKINFKPLVSVLFLFVLTLIIVIPSPSFARSPEAADDFDVNLRKRMPGGYIEVNPPYPNSNTIGLPPEAEDLRKIQVGGPTDNLAPQLNTLVGTTTNPDPQFTHLYTVKQWSGGALGDNIQADYTGNWGTVLTALQTGDGDEIRVPQSGYTIDGENHQVTVLYATESDITLHYGTQDSIAVGYAIHLLDFNVDPTLLQAYIDNEANGRTTLLALPCGFVLGTAKNSEVKVAIRDTGSFIDPRIDKDWWNHAPISGINCEGEMSLIEPSEDTQQRPLTDFSPDTIACNQTVSQEFHPLRPYPANSCDPLIPQAIPSAVGRLAPDYMKYITYSCGSQLQPVGTEAFDPYGDNEKYYALKVDNGVEGPNRKVYDHTICERDPGSLHVTCWRSSSFDVTVDLKDANLGILGNTQDANLTDEQKVNEYLSYYLTGVPQIADPTIDITQEETDRLINFSGPLRKLLPWDLQNSEARATLTDPKVVDTDVHDYNINAEGYFGSLDQNLSKFDTPPDRNDEKYKDNVDQYNKDYRAWRYGNDSIIPNIFGLDLVQAFKQVFNLQTTASKLFQNIPLASVEDTAGEFILTMFSDSADENENIGQHSSQGRQTAPSELTIRSSQKASGGPGTVTTLPSTYQNKTTTSINCGTNLKVMPLGDSITVGVHSPGGQTPVSPGGYRQPLKNNLVAAGYTIDFVGGSTQTATPPVANDNEHEGWNAFSTDYLLTGYGNYPGIETAIKNADPDIVLMHVGTNRLGSLGVEANLNNVNEMIDKIHAHNPNIIIFLAKIIQLPLYFDPQDNTSAWNQYNDELGKRFGGDTNVVIVDMSNIAPGSDQTHPTSTGYTSMANAWTAAIKANCK